MARILTRDCPAGSDMADVLENRLESFRLVAPLGAGGSRERGPEEEETMVAINTTTVLSRMC
ncbi:hypothetical protein GCM10008940_32520 [Microbulbifer agarilyticus]